MDTWSVYWKSGICTSFGDRLPQWYKRTLHPFWVKAFSHLPACSRVLDVASGNGAVAEIAARVSIEQKKQLRIVAVDKADLAPKGMEGNCAEQIEFLPNMPLETLRIPGRRFDLVCSQFGLEYAKAALAFRSVQNVLEPNGSLLMVAHHSASIICGSSREELQQYRSLLKEYPLFAKLALLLQAMGDIRRRSDLQALSDNPVSEKQRAAFNRVVGKLLHRHPEGVVLADVLQRINPLFKEKVTLPLPAKLRYVRRLEQEMMYAQQRLLDLTAAALNEKGMQKFLRLAENSGLETEICEKMLDEAGLLAWVIRFRKNNRYGS